MTLAGLLYGRPRDPPGYRAAPRTREWVASLAEQRPSRPAHLASRTTLGGERSPARAKRSQRATHNHTPPDPAAFIASRSRRCHHPLVVRSFASPSSMAPSSPTSGSVNTQTHSRPCAIGGRAGPEVAFPFHHRQRTVGPEVSAGIALYPEDANTPAALLLAADVEMHASKRAGRMPVAGRPTPARQSGLVSAEKRRTRRRRNPRTLSLRARYRGHEQGPPPRPSGPGARAMIGHLERPLVDPPFLCGADQRPTDVITAGPALVAVRCLMSEE